MTTGPACTEARVELSARLDGELDSAAAGALERHLEECPACRSHATEIARVRRVLRAQPAEPVPDLSAEIMSRVERLADRGAGTGRERLRVGAVAATVAALLVAGAALPFVERPPNLAAAGDITREVRAAARTLRSYRARFSVVERGWHPRVPVRRMRATVSFLAPERFRLEIRDHTRYPRGGSWPRNDVVLISTPRRWSIREPWSCPAGGLPRCAVGIERRRIVARQPFDGTSSLPTDIIVPLETLAGSGGFAVLGEDRVLGRPAYRLLLPYRRAAPLVSSLQAGGVWRPFEPFDRVHLWIDRRTWFPLRFEVRRRGGPTLLSVRALSFRRSRPPASSAFHPSRAGLTKDAGFRGRSRLESRPPAYVAGLRPYRQGVTSTGQEIRSYAKGLTWLKVTYDDPTEPDLVTTAEEASLGRSGYAYYQPAAGWAEEGPTSRRVDVFGRVARVHLESNLPRSELLRVARSLGVRGQRLRGTVRRGGVRVKRLAPEAAARRPFVLTPAYLPEGYAPSSAFLTWSRGGRKTVTIHYRRAETDFDGFGIRLTQGGPITLLPPTSESLHSFRVAGRSVRWSEERGEAEWREGSTYRAVAAPSFGWETAARIIESLR